MNATIHIFPPPDPPTPRSMTTFTVIGLFSCRGCHAPLPAHDRRARWCDDCRPAEKPQPKTTRRYRRDPDASKALKRATCRCERPGIRYVEDDELMCSSCGHAVAAARAA